MAIKRDCPPSGRGAFEALSQRWRREYVECNIVNSEGSKILPLVLRSGGWISNESTVTIVVGSMSTEDSSDLAHLLSDGKVQIWEYSEPKKRSIFGELNLDLVEKPVRVMRGSDEQAPSKFASSVLRFEEPGYWRGWQQ